MNIHITKCIKTRQNVLLLLLLLISVIHKLVISGEYARRRNIITNLSILRLLTDSWNYPLLHHEYITNVTSTLRMTADDDAGDAVYIRSAHWLAVHLATCNL